MLVVAITGTGDITYNNAEALLDDYLPIDDVLVYVPSYITSDGLKVVVQWLKDANIKVERVKKDLMSSFLLGNPEYQDKSLIVLGVEDSEEIIQEVLEEQCAVYDLTRGLYRVSEADLPLDGSVSNAESLTGEVGTPVGSSNDLGLDLLTETQGGYPLAMDINDVVRDLVRRVVRLEQEINWEHTANPRMPVAPENDPAVEVGDSTEGRTKYYQNGKGKIRKAGRSRIKPGEKEVWLSDEEAAELEK